MLKRAGPDGMSKVVNEFTTNHPEISKRQTELKVFEVAVKEKQHDDTKQVIHSTLLSYSHTYGHFIWTIHIKSFHH